ncbi:putative leader peptide [Streptomyces sp. NPDC006610]|uniref:putative leader peptide n=1 Tax=Streptomyces sp. NPDC006610 TaxID=3154584 RepID=UPI0033B764D9
MGALTHANRWLPLLTTRRHIDLGRTSSAICRPCDAPATDASPGDAPSSHLPDRPFPREDTPCLPQDRSPPCAPSPS